MATKITSRVALAPIDRSQRYTIAETVLYLRLSHASVYKEINAGRLRVIKQGKRTFVPGSEIVRVSTLPGVPADQGKKPEPSPQMEVKRDTAYRLLDSRIHQALMRDIARQQTLWDSLQKLDGKLQYVAGLVEKLSQNASRQTSAAEPAISPQFLRLKDIVALVGLRVSTIYRYMALGAFPKPKKFGRSSLWVAAEVNQWIARRVAGGPIEICNGADAPGP